MAKSIDVNVLTFGAGEEHKILKYENDQQHESQSKICPSKNKNNKKKKKTKYTEI